MPDRADDVAEVDVDLAHAVGGAQELDAAGAVDEVEEGQLAEVAAGEHAPGEAALVLGLGVRVEQLRLGADGRRLAPVGEALRRGHPGRPRRAPAASPTPAGLPRASVPRE